MDPKLSVKFDNSDLLSFVQGEDRSFQLTFEDDTTGTPFDLTTMLKIQVNLPRLGGGTIKRISTGFAVLNANIDVNTGFIFLADHGLVADEIVRVSTTGVLPTGYLAATDYKIQYVDVNTFGLKLASTDTLVTPTTQGSGDMIVTQQNVFVTGSGDNPVLGQITLNAPKVVTSQVKDGLGQSFQTQLLDATSDLRIIVLATSLDVVAQPAP